MNDFPPTAGTVLMADDEAFADEVAGYYRLLKHRPAYVVVAADAQDIVTAVRFAAERGLPIGVQATGHGPSTPADGGVLVSTRFLRTLQVDPATRTARFAAGVRSGEILQAAAPHGLAPLGGSSPGVGAVSYMLSGGIPLMGRRFGYAADPVRAIEVVTPAGELRRATAEQEPDLFWALRGGGGNFGIVTAMEIDLLPVSRIYGGGLHFGADAAADVLRAYREWTSAMPDAMGSSIMLINMPDLPQVPEPLRGRYLAHVRFAFVGEPAEGERLVRPLRMLADPLVDTVRDMPYAEVATIHAEPTQPVPFYARTSSLRALEAETVETVLSLAGPSAAAPYFVELRHLGGALGRAPRIANAAGRRDAAFSIYTGSVVVNDNLELLRTAQAGLHEALLPWSTGGLCLNFLTGPDAQPERVRSAYQPADFARLQAIKAHFDPRNLFRFNHNIPPAV